MILRCGSKRRMARIKWALSLKPGDMINDCTGFNVKIIKINPDIRYTKSGWYICNVDFDVTPFGGGCSLNHCGIVPPIPREKIESDMLEHLESYISSGTLAEWYGKDTKAFNEALSDCQKKIDTIRSGGHITNEHGMILKEFCKYPDNYIE